MGYRASLVAFVLGGVLFTGILGYYGAIRILEGLQAAGWGLVLVALYHLVPIWADARAWKTLTSPSATLSTRLLMRARWMGEALNSLLPMAQVGGDLLKARVIPSELLSRERSLASCVAEITVAFFSLFVFTLVGLIIFAYQFGHTTVVLRASLGVVVMGGAVLGFLAVQKRGVFECLIRRLTSWITLQDPDQWLGDAARLDGMIREIYRDRMRVARSVIWRLFGWILGTGEVWLALYFLGHPVGWTEALVLESLGQAVRNAAFLIPGGLGVQEGGFVILGSVFGLSPEVSIALSLAKRVREWMLGLPGLVAWQWLEGRRLHGWLAK